MRIGGFTDLAEPLQGSVGEVEDFVMANMGDMAGLNSLDPIPACSCPMCQLCGLMIGEPPLSDWVPPIQFETDWSDFYELYPELKMVEEGTVHVSGLGKRKRDDE